MNRKFAAFGLLSLALVPTSPARAADPQDGITLSLSPGAAPGEVSLAWTSSEGGPSAIYRSASGPPEWNEANALGTTGGQAWSDTPPAGAILFYRVVPGAFWRRDISSAPADPEDLPVNLPQRKEVYTSPEMQGPGRSLRQERESHGKTIEEMSEATGIRLPFLTALEQDAFDSLPGRGFGKLYIRAYAEVLGFDPRPVVEAYDRAVRETDTAAPTSEPAETPRPANTVLARWRAELIAKRAEADPLEEPEELTFDRLEAVEAPEPEAPIEARAPALPAETASPSRPARSRQWLVATLLLLVSLPVLAYFVLSRSTPGPTPLSARNEAVPGKALAPPPSPAPPPRAVEAPRTAPRAPSPKREQATPSPVQAGSSSLEVVESGVGLKLVGARLEGEGDRFRSGQRVTFATRVLGGGTGESIQHVWLRDGKVEQSIRLRLGGASWRTWSTKTLGRPGAWTVEARDEAGRVLARADLEVAP